MESSQLVSNMVLQVQSMVLLAPKTQRKTMQCPLVMSLNLMSLNFMSLVIKSHAINYIFFREQIKRDDCFMKWKLVEQSMIFFLP